MKKFLITTLLLSVASLTSMVYAGGTRLRDANINKLLATQEIGAISVHDPSIVYNPSNSTYYIVGSHRGLGKSTDLINWQELPSGKWVIAPNPLDNYQDGSYLFNKPIWQAFKSNPTHQVKLADESTGTLESFDVSAFCAIYDSKGDSAHIIGNMWAPDVIYNKEMGKWCYYLSLNGDHWASVIILMTGDSPVGPFTYEAPVVFSGFNNYSYSGKKVNYKNTDLELVLGPQSSLPTRYNVGESWGTYYPNCIDPNVFYDEDGELWLIYGSWSGGIYSLKLDKNTGLRDYTVSYGNKTSTSPSTGDDAYFGKKIAGGYYVSGEGPYIRYIGGYYYLFMSYGGFAPGGYDEKGKPQGGYDMRIFRSTSPTGPFKDQNGISAIYNSYQMNYGPTSASNRGHKIIGAYNDWANMWVGECAQGHNSAIVGADGEAYVVFHTKFNDGTYGHQVRVHRLFVNENGWLVCSPFRYLGTQNALTGNYAVPTTTQEMIETSQILTTQQVAGTYQLIIHPYKLDYKIFEEKVPMEVVLSEDGKVSGAYTGTWKYSEEGKSYITLTINGRIYYGVVEQQEINGVTGSDNKVHGGHMFANCITALCQSTGEPVWLYTLEEESAIAYNFDKITNYLSKDITKSAPYSLFNIETSFTSSDESIFTTEGRLIPPQEDKTLNLTARLDGSKYYGQITRNGLAVPANNADVTTGKIAHYALDAVDNKNEFNPNEQMTVGRASTTGTVPTIFEDPVRGNVLHQYFGAISACSYTRMSNPLYTSNADAFTVSFWVKPISKTQYDAYFGFLNTTSVTNTTLGRFFFTDNTYTGFNDQAGNWFDINHPSTAKYNDLPASQWSFVTMTMDKDGYTLYINGEAQKNHTYDGSATASTFNYASAISKICGYQYMYLGAGSFWGSSNAYLSDLSVYNRALTAADINLLYSNSITPTGIQDVQKVEKQKIETRKVVENGQIVIYRDGKCYNMQGQRIK